MKFFVVQYLVSQGRQHRRNVMFYTNLRSQEKINWFFVGIGSFVLICSSWSYSKEEEKSQPRTITSQSTNARQELHPSTSYSSDAREEERTSSIVFNKVYRPSRDFKYESSVDESHPLFSTHRLPPFENLKIKRAYRNRGPLTTGILLEFQKWPNEEEAKLIFEITNKIGLVQKTDIKQGGSFKTWIFKWPYITWRSRAIEACESFPEEIHQILEHCSSNSIGYPG